MSPSNPTSRAPAVAKSPPGTGGLAPRLRELGECLTALHAAMKTLGELAAEKLAGLRAADPAALERCARREEEVLREVFRGEQPRKAVLARVAQGLHMAEPARVRLPEVAERLPEPLASSLRARNAALRATVGDLQRKNRLAARVAQNLQSHIRGVFAEVARAAQESLVYGPQGQHEVGRPRSWVEAIG